MKVNVKLQPRSTPRKWRKVEAETEAYRNKVFNLYVQKYNLTVFHGAEAKFAGAVNETKGFSYKLLGLGYGKMSVEDFADSLSDFSSFMALYGYTVPVDLASAIFDLWLSKDEHLRDYVAFYWSKHGKIPYLGKVSGLKSRVLAIEELAPNALDLISKMDVDAQDILCSILKRNLKPDEVVSRKAVLKALGKHKNIFQALSIPRVKWAALTLYGNYNFRTIIDPDTQPPPQDLSDFWTGLPQSIRARLILGETPKELSGNTLSRAEAYAWLKARNERKYPYSSHQMGSWKYELPGSWLIWSHTEADESYEGGHSIESEHLEKISHRVNSVLVARWLIDLKRRGGWKSVTKDRVQHGPAGHVLRGNLLSRIDEIKDQDLINGIKTSAEDAMNAAGERFFREIMKGIKNPDMALNDWPSDWPRPLSGMRPLLTPAELVLQGKTQDNCVGGYIMSTQRGDSICIGIDVVEEENSYSSTVELSRNPHSPRIFQHYGKGNSSPSAQCKRVLNQWLNQFQAISDSPNEHEDDEMIPF